MPSPIDYIRFSNETLNDYMLVYPGQHTIHPSFGQIYFREMPDLFSPGERRSNTNDRAFISGSVLGNIVLHSGMVRVFEMGVKGQYFSDTYKKFIKLCGGRRVYVSFKNNNSVDGEKTYEAQLVGVDEALWKPGMQEPTLHFNITLKFSNWEF